MTTLNIHFLDFVEKIVAVLNRINKILVVDGTNIVSFSTLGKDHKRIKFWEVVLNISNLQYFQLKKLATKLNKVDKSSIDAK